VQITWTSDDRVEQSRTFTALIEALITEQDNAAAASYEVRLREMFTEFNNGRIEIDGKRHTLPRFDSVDMIEDGRGPFVIGRYGEKYVVAAIRGAAMGENDVLDFLSVCYGYRENIARKILIPLSGMEPNARLMAKEARIWVWELDSANMLMDLFGKKRIVMGGCV